jgi:hypothetical protein
MSRKKAERKYRQEAIKDIRFRMDDAISEAESFFETASPLGVSVALTKIGVSTAHRSGIERVLDHTWEMLRSPDLDPAERGKALIAALRDLWQEEIRAKGRDRTLEDRVFLIEAAQHFVSAWASVRAKRNENQIRLATEKLSAIPAEIPLNGALA